MLMYTFAPHVFLSPRSLEKGIDSRFLGLGIKRRKATTPAFPGGWGRQYSIQHYL